MSANAKRHFEPVGVFGNTVFIVGDSIIFLPTRELRGKTKKGMMAIVDDAVVREITGLDEVSFDKVTAISQIFESNGVEIDKLLDSEELALLDTGTLQEIRKFSTETGLLVENLVAVNAVFEELLAEKLEHFIDELETMVDEGLADEMESFMSDLSQIEVGIENLLGFGGYDDCVAGGGSVCHQVQAAHDNSGLN